MASLVLPYTPERTERKGDCYHAQLPPNVNASGGACRGLNCQRATPEIASAHIYQSEKEPIAKKKPIAKKGEFFLIRNCARELCEQKQLKSKQNLKLKFLKVATECRNVCEYLREENKSERKEKNCTQFAQIKEKMEG